MLLPRTFATLLSGSLAALVGTLVTEATAIAQDAHVECVVSPVPSKGAYYCTNDRGQNWYTDMNGAPAQTRQSAPRVYGDPAGAALAGKRAAIEDAARLRELQQSQQQVSPANDQYSNPQFQIDGAKCGQAAIQAFADEPSRMAYYDACMGQHGWKKPSGGP